MIKLICILILVLLSYSVMRSDDLLNASKRKIISTKQYENNYSFAGGFTFLSLLGETAGVREIYDNNNEEGHIVKPGGSYKMAQRGAELRATFYLGEEGKFRVPVGMDFMWFSAKRSYAETGNYFIKINNSVNVMGFYTGLDYEIVKFWNGNVNMYGGLRIKGNYFFDHEFKLEQVNKNDEDIEEKRFNHKSNTFKLTPMLSLGFEGEIEKFIHLNFNYTIGPLNLIGRDDDRGELLTNTKSYTNYSEAAENFEFVSQFSLLIQFRM